MRMACDMSDAEIRAEIAEINDRLAGMDLGYGDRWPSEESQIKERKKLLQLVLNRRPIPVVPVEAFEEGQG